MEYGGVGEAGAPNTPHGCLHVLPLLQASRSRLCRWHTSTFWVLLLFFFFFQGSASRSIYRSAHDGPRAPPGDLKDFVCNLSLPRSRSHIQKGLFLYFHPSLDGERECVAASASLICSRSRHAVNLFFFFSPTLSGATAVSPHNCTCWCVCRR